jgi:hypothetical protein
MIAMYAAVVVALALLMVLGYTVGKLIEELLSEPMRRWRERRRQRQVSVPVVPSRGSESSRTTGGLPMPGSRPAAGTTSRRSEP